MTQMSQSDEKQALLKPNEKLIVPQESHNSLLSFIFPSIVEPKIGASFYKNMCNKIQNNANDGDGFDIYQMTAFLKYYHVSESNSRIKYLFYCFKSFICGSIQTFGMIAFLYNILYTEDNLILECTISAPIELEILATLFSIYISLQMVGLVRVLKNQGLYRDIAYSPPFFDSAWLYIGLYCNTISLLFSIYGSFLIIYISETALDIVLNSVALYFIMDLDNFMVDNFDYSRLKNWMEQEFIFNDWFNDDWYNKNEGDIRFIVLCGMTLQISDRIDTNCCGKCKICCIFIGGLFMYFAIIVGVIGACVAPIAIAVCY